MNGGVLFWVIVWIGVGLGVLRWIVEAWGEAKRG